MSEDKTPEEQEADNLIQQETERVEKKEAETLPGIGHNTEGLSGNRLKSFIERVERLEEERKAINEDIKDIYSEAKASGFDSKILRKIVSLRKKNIEKRREESELLDLYMCAIGMDV